MKSQPKIILASTSPQRLKILTNAGFDPLVLPGTYEEINNPALNPEQQAREHAFRKAKSVADVLNEGIVIGCDTIVNVDGKLIGKPEDEEEAKAILQLQSGKTVEVISGLCMINSENHRNIIHTETTYVKFLTLNHDEIEWYIATGEWKDKSGGFSIQTLGSRYISRIEGDYLNVVGLPLCKVYETLRNWGY